MKLVVCQPLSELAAARHLRAMCCGSPVGWRGVVPEQGERTLAGLLNLLAMQGAGWQPGWLIAQRGRLSESPAATEPGALPR